jgi:integrase
MTSCRSGATPIYGGSTNTPWVEDEYRVEDRDATVAKYGGQSRTKRRQVMKMPGVTTLGNLDHALLHIWQEAVADKVVERRTRPVIDKTLGEDSEPRVFIDETGVQAVFRVMTDEWIAAGGHSADLRRMLRAYVAMISTTGIRAGLEAKRVRIGYVKFDYQRGVPVILIRVERRQGKYAKPRNVIVYEGDRWVSVRRLLREHIAWRIAKGATDRDYLFAWPDGTFPPFRRLLDDVLRAANALTDPMTGEKRVAYSFRHYFATKLIGLEAGLSVPVIAECLGTSSQMIERHYNQ